MSETLKPRESFSSEEKLASNEIDYERVSTEKNKVICQFQESKLSKDDQAEFLYLLVEGLADVDSLEEQRKLLESAIGADLSKASPSTIMKLVAEFELMFKQVAPEDLLENQNSENENTKTPESNVTENEGDGNSNLEIASEEADPTGGVPALINTIGGVPALREPVPEKLEPDTPLKVMLIDTSMDVRTAAIDFANRRLTSELAENEANTPIGRFANLIKNMPKRIWKGSLFKEYYRAKYAQEAARDLAKEGNFVDQDATPEQLSQARQALFERFGLDYEEMIHTDAGERREQLAEQDQFVQDSKEIIRKYVSESEADFDQDSLQEAVNRLLARRTRNNSELSGQTLLEVTNLLEVAKAVKGRVEHGQSLDRVLENMQFFGGEARTGVRTNLSESMTDKIFEKMSSSRTFRTIAPDALLVAAGTTSMLVNWGGKRAVATAMTFAMGGSGAVLAGMREHKRTKEDRIQHEREMAQGGRIEEGSKRRQEMEQVRYETRSAADLTSNLLAAAEALAKPEADHLQQIKAALDTLTDAKARTELSDASGIDLITYSSQAAIGDERLKFNLARAELRVQLEKMLNQMSPGQRLDHGLAGGVREIVNLRLAEASKTLEAEVKAKDRAFRALKARRVTKAAAAGLVTGLAVGLLTQEISALFNDQKQGLLESALGKRDEVGPDGKLNQTLLHSWVRGETRVVPSYSSGDLIQTRIPGSESTINLPKDMSLIPDGQGEFQLIDAKGNLVLGEITIDSSGQIEASDLVALRTHGINLIENSETVSVVGAPIERSVEVSPAEYAHQHGATKVSREFWYDNDTLAFDQNELGLHEAGLQADGTLRYSVAGMTEFGSSTGDRAVDWSELAARGEMKFALSASEGTQSEVFLLDISPEGNIDITPDHPAYKLFAPDENGFNFKGAFGEACQTVDQLDGSYNIRPLATIVGENSLDSLETVVVEAEPVVQTVFNYDFVPGVNLVEGLTEPAPVLPVVGRRSLEELGESEPAGEDEKTTTSPSGDTSPERSSDNIVSRSSTPIASEAVLIEPTEVEFINQEMYELIESRLSESVNLLAAAERQYYLKNYYNLTPEFYELSEVSGVVAIKLNAVGREFVRQKFNAKMGPGRETFGRRLIKKI